MADNLIETVEGRLTPDVVENVASSIGESPSKTSRALSAAVPSILGGLIQNGATEAGVAKLLRELTDPAVGQAGMSTSRGSELFTSVLGDRSGPMTDEVASASGVSRASSSSIMGFLFPMIASVIGTHVTSRRLGVSGLAELLASHRSAVARHPSLPPAVAERLGLGREAPASSRRELAAPATGRARYVAPAVVGRRKAMSAAWWPLIAAAAAIALVLLGIASIARRGPARDLSSAPSPGAEAPIAGRPTAVLPETPKVIPGAANQTGQEGAEEPTSTTTLTGADIDTTKGEGASGDVATSAAGDDLAKAFSDGSSARSDRVTLSSVNFDVGTADLAAGSQPTVDRLAALLKEHPKARIRLEGFTDASGAAETNAPLSDARASTVKKLLVDRGIAEDRIQAVGRGDQEPLADNASAAGRARNRRIDVVVLSR